MSVFIEQIKKIGVIYKPLLWLYLHCLDVKKRIYNYKHRERRFSFGEENVDETFYVIGVSHDTAGLFAIVKSAFCHICYALQKGYVPVVDMQNFKSQLSDINNTEKNAWELYFKQPGGYSLDSISKSRNIIKSSSLPYPKGVEIGFDTSMDEVFYKNFSPLYKKFIIPTSEVAEYAQQKLEVVIGNRCHVLGVLCRGTDYTDSKPSGHPIQPTAEQAINKAKEVMSQNGFEYVFLATEDKRIYNAFLDAFGNKLLFSGQKLYEGLNGKKFLSELSANSYSEKWHDIVDYYSTIYILSMCEGLLAGLTCGSICAYLMHNTYSYTYFWDLGRYR